MTSTVRDRTLSTDSNDIVTPTYSPEEEERVKRLETIEKIDSLKSVWVARGLIIGSALSPLFFSTVCPKNAHIEGCENRTFVIMGLFFGCISYQIIKILQR